MNFETGQYFSAYQIGHIVFVNVHGAPTTDLASNTVFISGLPTPKTGVLFTLWISKTTCYSAVVGKSGICLPSQEMTKNTWVNGFVVYVTD